VKRETPRENAEGSSSWTAAPDTVTTRRQSPAWHAVATSTYVVARSGRGRWLLVWRCPECQQRHVSQVRQLAETMTRPAACDGVRVLLHVAGVREAAA
jgi:hypothetical protein